MGVPDEQLARERGTRFLMSIVDRDGTLDEAKFGDLVDGVLAASRVDEDETRAELEAAARIEKFCDEWAKLRGNDPEFVYGLHLGNDREASITISDLRILVARLSEPSPEGTQ